MKTWHFENAVCIVALATTVIATGGAFDWRRVHPMAVMPSG